MSPWQVHRWPPWLVVYTTPGGDALLTHGLPTRRLRQRLRATQASLTCPPTADPPQRGAEVSDAWQVRALVVRVAPARPPTPGRAHQRIMAGLVPMIDGT